MTTIPQEAFFVSTAWLAEHLGAPDVAVIDGTFFLPDEKRDAKAEYLEGHIPGAVFFDIDAIADHTTNLPHMLPHPSGFAEAMEKLGLGDGMRFVVYDASNLEGGARVWWTLRVFGARDVKILAGGLPRWRAEGRPLERGLVRRMPRPFTVDFDQRLRCRCRKGEEGKRSRFGADSRCASGGAVRRHRQPSRVPDCARATFPAVSICLGARWSNPARSNRRTKSRPSWRRLGWMLNAR